MKKKSWLIVTNKWSYLLLASVPIALLIIVIDGVHTMNTVGLNAGYLGRCVAVLFITMICVILFRKMNVYSPWMNPNHPKPNE